MIAIEANLQLIREAGVDPDEVESSLPACKCGKPQVIAAIGAVPVNNRVMVLIRCTETDRKVCRVSKRLRMYRWKLAVETEEAAAPEADPEVTAEEQAAAEKMADAMVEAMEDGATAEEAAEVAKAALAEDAAVDAAVEAGESALPDDEDSEEW